MAKLRQPKEWPIVWPELREGIALHEQDDRRSRYCQVSHQRYFRKLTPAKLNEFRRFNALLVRAGKQINRDLRETYGNLHHARRRLTDYEVEVFLEFFLDDHDPARLEDDDNLIAKVMVIGNGLLDDTWREDWGEALTYADGPLAGEQFCYLLHLLWDAHVPIPDLLRAGYVWAELHIRRQHCYELKRNRFVRRPWSGKKNPLGRK